MKLTSPFLLPALCWQLATATASAPHGDVYTFDHSSQQPRPDRTLSPVAARLVLAQRGGLEDFHSANLYDKDVIEAINDYGRPSPLFSHQPASHGTVESALILVNGLSEEDAATYASWTQLPDFKISPLPSREGTEELFDDFELQAQSLRENRRASTYTYESLGDAKIQLEGLMNLGNVDITILINPIPIPLTSDPHPNTATWGTYTMPNIPSHLQKRQQSEEPLEDFKPVESSTSRQEITPLIASQSSPLPGILPACFSSLSSCNEQTRNCTSHGSCSLKYTDSSQKPAKPCYACQCSATKQTNGDGKEKTTHWGGPACQKKDVSVEFWLIALFSVGLVGLVSFAVGQVWSMGDEELPSVIGAGVSGPVARR